MDSLVEKLRAAGVPDRGWHPENARQFANDVAYYAPAILRVLLEERLAEMAPYLLSAQLTRGGMVQDPGVFLLSLLCPEVPDATP